ncbi:hypothetical protein [Arthrobacter cryoconiti]|uniref:Lipoprotein n=1 Tax=Arthrobacter cryoconiti TaxID=748907 RepID=A0ABV8R252_9MICC|nr:hypothetical protein [Arthrobacter cryoconiti]MCC9068005.1 hypothetical protein [Arthrobacter cryoconiti]
MSGCSAGSTASNSATSPNSSQPQVSEQANDALTNDLLRLNDSLKISLGPAYSDAWIQDNELHVAVTTQEAEKAVKGAGAIPQLVDFNAEQLQGAVQAISTWQSQLPSLQGAAIHKIIPDGRSATVSIYVAPEQIDAVAAAAARDNPSGKIPLVIKESAGIATPLLTPATAP